MKESETIEEYPNRLVRITNKVRLLGTDLSANRSVEKVLVYLHERFKATIASL